MVRAEDFFEPLQGRPGTMPVSVARKIDDAVAAAKARRGAEKARRAMQRAAVKAATAPPIEASADMARDVLDAQRALTRASWWREIPADFQDTLLDAVAALHRGAMTHADFRRLVMAARAEAERSR